MGDRTLTYFFRFYLSPKKKTESESAKEEPEEPIEDLIRAIQGSNGHE